MTGIVLRSDTRPALSGGLLFAEAQIVQWCGHAQHFLVVPDADGERAALVPIYGEAAA